LERLSDQQIGQVYELMQAIQKRGRDSVDEQEQEVMAAIEQAATGGKKP
jgi:hypothetical protein